MISVKFFSDVENWKNYWINDKENKKKEEKQLKGKYVLIKDF